MGGVGGVGVVGGVGGVEGGLDDDSEENRTLC